MSNRLRRNLPALTALYRGSTQQRRNILQSASKDLILTFCEIALNVLRGNVPLTAEQFKKLKKLKTKIKLCADKKTSLARKRKAIQTGGFLLPLLSVALPLLGNLFAARGGGGG